MSELHKFLFEGLPVRGMLVRLTDGWQEVLRRREGSDDPYEAPVRTLLGEMAAASVLMQANIKFNGSLILQVFGDGPMKVAVAEADHRMGFRTTAKVAGELPSTDSGRLPLDELVNVHGQGRCAITLDPQDRLPGQQPYQGVVPLSDDEHKPFKELSAALEHYMLKSEQLDTRLILAANDEVAAGLLIQRLPLEGEGNLAGQGVDDEAALNESYNRIAHLAASLTREELLTLDAETVLHRLFWEEDILRFPALAEGAEAPHFACSCSRERVASMLQSLGSEELESILEEQQKIEVACDFCGERYSFDSVDVGELMTEEMALPPGTSRLQ